MQSSGHLVQYVGRPNLKSALEKEGLLISNWQNSQTHISPGDISFSTELTTLHKPDIVFVTVKSRDCEAATGDLAKLVDTKTLIIGLQNGIQAGEILENLLSDHSVVKGIVAFNVVRKSAVNFHCGTQGDLILENHPECRRLTGQGSINGLSLKLVEDINGVQWTKLIMNLNNAVNALSGIPLLQQLHDRGYRRVMASVIQEALTTIRSADIKTQRIGNIFPGSLPFILSLPNWLFKRVASAMLAIDPHARSSMYEDLVNRRPTEIDFINGEIVRLAKRAGASAPINEKIIALVKAAEQQKTGSPALSADKLL